MSDDDEMVELIRVFREAWNQAAVEVLASGATAMDGDKPARAGVVAVLDLAERRRHDGGHGYLSTGCLHDDHDYCKGDTGAAGAKIPAQCKFCAAPCICTCHTTDGPVDGQHRLSELPVDPALLEHVDEQLADPTKFVERTRRVNRERIEEHVERMTEDGQ